MSYTPSGDIKWRHPDAFKREDDRERMTSAHAATEQRPRYPIPKTMTPSIAGKKERRDGQLARRFLYAGYELIEVKDWGSYSSEPKRYDLYFRRRGCTEFEYQWAIKGFEFLEAATKEAHILRYLLWEQTRWAHTHRLRIYDAYEKPEHNAQEAYGYAAGRLMAANVGGRVLSGAVDRKAEQASLRGTLARYKECVAARLAIYAERDRLVGPEPPKPPEGFIFGRTHWIRPA